MTQGEIVVSSFAMPLNAASLHQQKDAMSNVTIPVIEMSAVKTMGSSKLSIVKRQVRLPMIAFDS
jgi:hypothetical protein